jgi:hypothetical protein
VPKNAFISINSGILRRNSTKVINDLYIYSVMGASEHLALIIQGALLLRTFIGSHIFLFLSELFSNPTESPFVLKIPKDSYDMCKLDKDKGKKQPQKQKTL